MDSRPDSRASGIGQAQKDIHHMAKCVRAKKAGLGWGVGCGVKCLPGTHKVLDSIPQEKRKEMKNLPAVERDAGQISLQISQEESDGPTLLGSPGT